MTTAPRSRPEPRWPRAAASIAVLRDHEVLLVRRGKQPLVGVWSLPGGRIEAGERASDAALRELGEETGCTAEVAGLVDVHDVILHDEAGELRAHYVLAVFAGRWIAGEPMAGDDAGEARFVAIADLAGLELTAGAAGYIARARSMLVAHRPS